MAHLAALPDPSPPARFARVALTGLAALAEGEAGSELALRLGLSAWLRLAGVGVAEAAAALAELRGPVLTGAGLDRDREPVPFRVPDPSQDVVLLAGYLADLLGRAGRRTGQSPAALVTRTLEALPA